MVYFRVSHSNAPTMDTQMGGWEDGSGQCHAMSVLGGHSLDSPDSSTWESEAGDLLGKLDS